MTSLAVISDSHGNEYSIVQALRAIGEYDAVIHLGDYAADAEAVCEKLGKPLYAVLGNCDFVHPPKADFQYEQVAEFEGVKLLLVHGHRHGIDGISTYDARDLAIRRGADALLYGHTHVSEVAMKDGILVMNPGSTSRPRAGRKPSAGLLVIENGKLQAKIVTI